MSKWLTKFGRAVASQVGFAEIILVYGLVLIAYGLWEVSRPAALAIPGFVLVWLALPPRPPFFRSK